MPVSFKLSAPVSGNVDVLAPEVGDVPQIHLADTSEGDDSDGDDFEDFDEDDFDDEFDDDFEEELEDEYDIETDFKNDGFDTSEDNGLASPTAAVALGGVAKQPRARHEQ